MIRQGSMSNLSSISNISRIPKDKNGLYNGDDSLMEYEVLVANSKTRNKGNNNCDLNNKNSIFITNKKPKMPILLKIKNKTQSTKKPQSTKYKIQDIYGIKAKQIVSFLTDQDIYQISEAQTEYMHLLDSIYHNKIQKIKELHNKYDNELFKLKEYVDESNKENINNIIYNSVLKDKNEELNEIEDEFNNNIELALLEYNDKSEKLKEAFKKEISNCVNYIKKDLFSKINQKN